MPRRGSFPPDTLACKDRGLVHEPDHEMDCLPNHRDGFRPDPFSGSRRT